MRADFLTSHQAASTRPPTPLPLPLPYSAHLHPPSTASSLSLARSAPSRLPTVLAQTEQLQRCRTAAWRRRGGRSSLVGHCTLASVRESCESSRRLKRQSSQRASSRRLPPSTPQAGWAPHSVTQARVSSLPTVDSFQLAEFPVSEIMDHKSAARHTPHHPSDGDIGEPARAPPRRCRDKLSHI